jgi:hypothetical protein
VAILKGLEMKTFKKLLAAIFAKRRHAAPPQPPRQPEPHQAEREESRLLAAARGFEIERHMDGYFIVHPPSKLVGPDPFEDDHRADDWAEVLVMARAYATTK